VKYPIHFSQWYIKFKSEEKHLYFMCHNGISGTWFYIQSDSLPTTHNISKLEINLGKKRCNRTGLGLWNSPCIRGFHWAQHQMMRNKRIGTHSRLYWKILSPGLKFVNPNGKIIRNWILGHGTPRYRRADTSMHMCYTSFYKAENFLQILFRVPYKLNSWRESCDIRIFEWKLMLYGSWHPYPVSSDSK